MEDYRRDQRCRSRSQMFHTTSVDFCRFPQTSITIDDVIYVVDAGKVKETGYDTTNGMSRLEEQWITRAAGRQRRGRAGRTQPGVCYKIYSRKQEAKMGKYPVPEILRVPLESVLLTIKAMREDADPKVSSFV